MIITGAEFHITTLFAIVPLILLILMIIGVGLILAVFNTYFSDVSYIYSIFTLLLMYASALFYPMEIVPSDIQMIFTLNPMYAVISAFRDTIMYGILPEFSSLLYLAVFSIMIFAVGFLLFRIHEKRLTLEL